MSKDNHTVDLSSDDDEKQQLQQKKRLPTSSSAWKVPDEYVRGRPSPPPMSQRGESHRNKKPRHSIPVIPRPSHVGSAGIPSHLNRTHRPPSGITSSRPPARVTSQERGNSTGPSPAAITKKKLNSMGQSNSNAIDVSDDSDDDDDEFELISTNGPPQVATAAAASTVPARGANLPNTAARFAHPPQGLPQRRPNSRGAASTSTGPLMVNSGSHFLPQDVKPSLGTHAVGKMGNTEGEGKAHDPIVIFDVDTEEDFKTMTAEAEVIVIDDDNDDDDDASSLGTSDKDDKEVNSAMIKQSLKDAAKAQSGSQSTVASHRSAPRSSCPDYAPPGRSIYRGKKNSSGVASAPTAVVELLSSDDEDDEERGQKTAKVNRRDSNQTGESDRKPPTRKRVGGQNDDPADSDSISCARMPSGEGTKEVKEVKKESEGETDEPYSLKEFSKLWCRVQSEVGDIGEIEKDIEFKTKVQKPYERYGRVLPRGMKGIFRNVMGLRSHHTYIDIGSGIGNTCIQAAYTIGCNAKGIECNETRAAYADKFNVAVAAEHKGKSGTTFVPGQVDLKMGGMQDPAFRNWQLHDTDFVFVNNFNGSFGDHLESQLAAIFASMKEGAVMVTMHPLLTKMGCLWQTCANAKREERGLQGSAANASYYEYKRYCIGIQKNIVSWSEHGGCDKPVYVHRYTRTKQSGKSVFLCNNRACEKAQNASPIEAVECDSSGAARIAICICRTTDKPTRQRCRPERFGHS